MLPPACHTLVVGKGLLQGQQDPQAAQPQGLVSVVRIAIQFK
jgi:hypothetical protein